MNAVKKFFGEVKRNARKQAGNRKFASLSKAWMRECTKLKYAYNFTWLGRPIIQIPQDIVAVQEVIWRTKPDLIVETGIAHGGSLILSASMLELIGGKGRVVGVDIDIRKHNRVEIEKHPMNKRILMIEGSSVDDAVFKKVRSVAAKRKRVMVMLDSYHSCAHVLRELALYSTLVTRGCYLIVFDTVVNQMTDLFPGKEWGESKDNNPMTAVRTFLKQSTRFVVDRDIQDRLTLSVAPEGYLRCVKD